MFIRHVFRDITLQDVSLVDHLVTAVGNSFLDASAACDIVCCVPENAADIRLRFILTSHNASPFVLERLLKKTMVALDSELRAVVHNHSEFPGTTNISTSWSTIGELHRLIAVVCLDTVDKTLRFNVCGIHTSYLPSKDKEVQEHVRRAKLEGRLTSTLIYACLGWAYHAAFLFLDERLIQAVTWLFGRPALCWLEIISLTGQDPSTVLPHLHKLRVSKRWPFLHLAICVVLPNGGDLSRVKIADLMRGLMTSLHSLISSPDQLVKAFRTSTSMPYCSPLPTPWYGRRSLKQRNPDSSRIQHGPGTLSA